MTQPVRDRAPVVRRLSSTLLAAVVAAAALAGVPAAAPATATAPALQAEATATDAPTLGLRRHSPPYGRGWGRVAPRVLYNGGSPGGLVRRLTWRNWGDGRTIGRGRGYTTMPGGGYYDKPVRTLLRASRIRTCGGHKAYTRLHVKQARRPGGPLPRRWRTWQGAGLPNLCASWESSFRQVAGTEAHYAPGRYGALKAGMGPDAAVATGMVRWVYTDEVCGWQLRLRRRYRRSWLATNSETDRIIAVGTFRKGPTTTKRVGVGTPLRVLRRKYGARLRGPDVNFYGQHVFWVRRQRNFISFFFNGEQLRRATPLGSMIVSRRRPIKIFEGEGPC
ncbi:hypothetical protein [Nocardioides pelophilus]|uniref:hypothetical protein n=1 Tax=Nocardioides pelophilus TaxID=2172019 RepID=UPI0016034D94|nr:hypothetical protein [Nocardioides pelophilus]